jgi:hypothetical protein
MLAQIIKDIRGLIGRDVSFYIVASSYPCATCGLDPVTGKSTDSFCPTCSGEYWIPVISETTVSGHITWGKAENLDWTTGGQFFDGDCRLQIEYSASNRNMVKNAKYVVVDDVRMSVRDVSYRGVPQLNRIVLTLDEEE